MATKGMKNLIGGIKSAFGKTDPVDTRKEEQAAVSKLRESERQMIAQLKKIDLNDPKNKLPKATINSLNIGGVINYAVETLNKPLIIEYDLSNLDKNIDYIIKALDDAVKEGRPMTAEWACTTLVSAINELRIDIAGVDEEYGKEMMECRVEYSTNLALLVKTCREYDHKNAALAKQKKRRDAENEKWEEKKNSLDQRINSGEVRDALAELQMNLHNPAALSPEAKALRDELLEKKRLERSVLEINIQIDADQLTLNNCMNEIKSRRNALANAPHVADPKYQERLDEANRLYRERLRRQLNDAEEAMRAYKLHISALKELANHSAYIAASAEAVEVAQEMELEQYRRQQIALQAQKARIRAEQNQQFVSEINIAQEVAHEPVVETVAEPEQNREVIQNDEYDFG